ncbi:g8310 [Coccomyxa viridis]|uniref:G8310 protein n=1 Tax=Coccomyxa viridis TaxID=1274662 RepID=A0ABP1G029_9CHLO
MPKGTELTLLPLCQGAPSPKLTTKHAFAFLTSARSIIQSFHADLGVPADDVSQAISDGLNDQGLSVTVQWDYDVPGLPDATSCNISTAVSAMDLSTYILASFATVEQVRQAVDPASFTVVNFHLSDAAMAILKEAGLIAPQGHPFIHLGISDAKHDSLVIEFIEGNTHALRENPAGVLTNEPQLPGHYRQLHSYMKSRFEVPQTAYQRFHPGTFAPVHYNSTFYAPPGDHSSQSRFIRLAMLNQVAGLRSWPEKEGWVPQGSGPSKGLWEAAENILNTIVLPPSIDDAGGAGVKNYDYTQVSILRDHVNLVYYFRSPASPQWQAVSLKDSAVMAGARNGQKPLFVVVPIAHNSKQPWYTDISSDVARGQRAT